MRVKFWIAAFLFLTSCVPQTAEAPLAIDPLAEVKAPIFSQAVGQTGIEQFDPPGVGGYVSLTIGAQVANPNPFPIRLTEVDYTVMIEDRQVLGGVLEPDLLLGREGTAPLRFTIGADLEKRPELLREVVHAFAENPLMIRVEGQISFSSLGDSFRTRSETLLETATLARQAVSAPVLRLDERESVVMVLHPEVPVVRIVLDAMNPGDIGYFLYGKDLQLSLAGERLAVDDLLPVPLPAGEQKQINLLFYPFSDLLGEPARFALSAALQGIPTSVAVTGQLYMDVLGLDTFPVPNDWEIFGFIDADP